MMVQCTVRCAALLVGFSVVVCIGTALAEPPNPRIWNTEPGLWDAAQEATIDQLVPAGDPQPVGTWGGGTAPYLGTQDLKMSLWGPPSQLTLSVRKTDVWDRRRYFEPPLKVDALIKQMETATEGLGNGDNYYRGWDAYDFPCPKPVGQIILRFPGLEGAQQPTLTTHFKNGLRSAVIAVGDRKAVLSYLPMMTRDIVAVRVDCQGLDKPVSTRLYRHCDTAIRGKSYSAHGGPEPQPLDGYDYAKDAENGPMDPPTSGSEDGVFWIRQQFPAEKTFPNGFEYVMAGLLVEPQQVAIETVEGEKGLGTLPSLNPEQQKKVDEQANFWKMLPTYRAIREAPGAAATATLSTAKVQAFTLIVVVVTSAEAADPLSEARRQLQEAKNIGFDGLLEENRAWFKALYDRREKGRVFTGNPDDARKQIPGLFNSWKCPHGGFCLPDPAHYEADTSYAYMEQDWAPWHGLPCYNELYFTSLHVQNQSERLVQYYSLVPFWLEACKQNARDVFDLPGAALLHGYLPPIKPDVYAHTTTVWEFCMEIPAQVLKVLWDRFDYGGDEAFLADTLYPALRETAIFYQHYAKLGEDGYYHVIPTVSAEHWGWTPKLERNKDSTSALCMFRWLLNRTAEASELLGRDADLRKQWVDVANRLAPYPTYDTPEGKVWTDVPGVDPTTNDYNWFAGVTPTLLADEINLDSDPKQIEMM
ncbi:MAG: hypothetical protein K1Y02_25765, partial [Candidatus Hydrogenedentes bacterium]|nr:hypothetical protein [Candidatus Hydrogenedentota bacterium]